MGRLSWVSLGALLLFVGGCGRTLASHPTVARDLDAPRAASTRAPTDGPARPASGDGEADSTDTRPGGATGGAQDRATRSALTAPDKRAPELPAAIDAVESVADSTAALLDAEPTADCHAYATLMAMPIAGTESSNFGLRSDPFRRRSKRMKLHKGIDFKAERGTTVHSAGAGVIKVARRKGSYGRLVIIDHGAGVESRYAHLQRILVKSGQVIASGQAVGTVGSSGRSTGPHLHFEVREDGRAIDPALALALGEALRAGALVSLTQQWAPWVQHAVVRAAATMPLQAEAEADATEAVPLPADRAAGGRPSAPTDRQSARLPSFQR